MPEPECEFKDLCYEVHMMLAEKEMLYKDSFCIVADIEDGQDSCIMYLLVKGYLNSPQFKKQYAKLSVVKKVLESLPVKNDDFVRDVMDEIEVVGRTE